MATTPGYQDIYVAQLLKDTVGFAGCKIIRRIVGLSHVIDIDNISNDIARETAQRKALSIGKQLVLSNRNINSIQDLIEIVKNTSQVTTEGVTYEFK
jgi:5-methylthioribose kinase